MRNATCMTKEQPNEKQSQYKLSTLKYASVTILQQQKEAREKVHKMSVLGTFTNTVYFVRNLWYYSDQLISPSTQIPSGALKVTQVYGSSVITCTGKFNIAKS